MIVQITKFKSGLSDEEADRVMRERAPRFREVPGLLQKYYTVDDETGERGAVYVWESAEAMQAFRESELAQGMSEAYRIEGDKRVEVLDVAMVLREET